jgi:hypothetical protein
MTGRVSTLIGVVAVAMLLAATTSALAQSSPAKTVYSPTGEVLDVVSGGGPGEVAPGAAGGAGGGGVAPSVNRESGGNAPTPSTASGSLPFTGFEAGLVALAGLVLVGTGFAMRRAARSGN